MVQQADIDALQASENEDIATIGSDVSAAKDAITAQKAAFDKFVADHPDVDISGLQAANQNLHDTLASSLGSIVSGIGTITAGGSGTGSASPASGTPDVAGAVDTSGPGSTGTGDGTPPSADTGTTGAGDATGNSGT